VTGATGLRWVTSQESAGVRERAFEVDGARGPVPGLLWTPAGAEGVRPLVLIGHGASGSKREAHVVALARRLVRHHRFAAAAIDGPVHGDRRADRGMVPGLAFLEFSQRWAGDPAMTDDMVTDWRGTLDRLQSLREVGVGPTGYWGLSMGTILGLPLVAAEERIGAAVLGLMGETGPTRQRVARDAAAVRCPVLFVVQWDDELFERSSAFALFERLGTADKRLHANPGPHSAVPADELDATEDFLVRRLAG
jgi:dienelactone hydrolase